MQTFKQAVAWLFGTPDGHFALLFTMLIVCGIGAALKINHAYEATAALAVPVFIKLKG